MLKTAKNKILIQLIISTLSILSVSYICYLFSAFIDYKIVAFLLLVVVSFLASFFEIVPVLFSAILSSLVWNYFFVTPLYTFSVNRVEDRIFFLMYFIIALVNAILTFKIKQYKKQISKKTEEANTFKLYDTILNSLSHELKTPLAMIIGSTDTLKENIAHLTKEGQIELLDEISEASQRLDLQVSNLLSVSRLETGSLKIKTDWCDISELLHFTVNSIENSTHRFIYQIDTSIPFVKLDYGLMETTIFNLIKNAILYTPADSDITISAYVSKTSSGHFEDDSKKIIIENNESLLVISISDNGIGIPEEEIPFIFDKFYRSDKSKTGGTGLGLSIVKGFVEAHNGTISVLNNNNGGATFTISIPTETNYLNNLKNE